MNSRLLIASAIVLSACSSNPFSQLSRSTSMAALESKQKHSVVAGLTRASAAELRQKIEVALIQAQTATSQAASALQNAIDGGESEDIDVASLMLQEAKEQEDSITESLEVIEVTKNSVSEKYRDQGLGAMDIDEAEVAIAAAEAEEERIRSALKSKSKLEATDDDEPSVEEVNPITGLIADLDAAEKVTIAARETLQEARDKGYGPMDIDEAEVAIAEAETKEDDVRDQIKALESSDDGDSTPEAEPTEPVVSEPSEPEVSDDDVSEPSEPEVSEQDDTDDQDTSTEGDTNDADTDDGASSDG